MSIHKKLEEGSREDKVRKMS